MILKEMQPGALYKVSGDPKHPDGLYGYVLDVAAPQTNAGEMSALYTASTPAIDRSREVVETKGIDLDDHKLIPNAFLGHNQTHRVGQTEDRLGNYKVWHADGPKLKAKIYYDQTTRIGTQTFIAVQEKRLRGASIGFIPKPGMVIKATGNDGHPVTVYKGCRLVEVSVVPTPDNPECIAEMVYKGLGGEPLCPELASYMTPFCPPKREMVTSGWEPVTKRSTYRSADPMEMEPKYRTPTYYNCPHCEEEVTHEHLYRDGDHTRHGACGGRVVMKPVEGGVIAVGTHPKPHSAGNQSPNTENLPVKTLGQYIAKRIGYLRRKAMDQDTMNGGAADEFLPVDDPVDPNADPNAAGDPHADHKAVADQAVGDIMASIYQKFTDKQIDRKTAHKLFDKCLRHHEDVSDLTGDGDDGFGDDEDFDDSDDFGGDGDDFDDDLSGGDDGDDSDADDDSDDKPDIADKKKKAEKAVAEIWAKSYEPTMNVVADGLAYILEEPDPDGPAVQKFVRKLLRKMQAAPEFDGLVTKALENVKKAEVSESAWKEWEGTFYSNGTH